MRQIAARIEDWTKRLEEHPFFRSLQPEPDLRHAMDFARSGVFWVFAFQDIIRLNSELARDPAIRQILQQHQTEDAGHEEWFLQDLEMIFGEAPTNIRWLFSDATFRIRAGSFALAGEVFRVTDDALRVILVEVLESAAGFFFGRVSQFLAESGHAAKLKYFAGVHLDAEAAHEIHDQVDGPALQSMVIPPHLRDDAEELVDRMYAAFWQLADAMFEHRHASNTLRTGRLDQF